MFSGGEDKTARIWDLRCVVEIGGREKISYICSPTCLVKTLKDTPNLYFLSEVLFEIMYMN